MRDGPLRYSKGLFYGWLAALIFALSMLKNSGVNPKNDAGMYCGIR
jgi:hypothetical protein